MLVDLWKPCKCTVDRFQTTTKIAEKTISKLLSIAVTQVLKYSTRIQQEKMSPWPAHHFVYQKDTTVPSYEKNLKEMKNDSSYRYCTILSSQSWKEYIKDPFNNNKKRAYLSHTVLESKKAKKPMNPPFGITFENLTTNAGPIEQQRCLLDVRHYNAHLLIPRLVCHLSTKLCQQIMSQRMGSKYEIELIQYLTRFGYATRTVP
jgi:hypothetical protein